MATISEVAKAAGVSKATVSYVLNGTGTVTAATRQRVLDAAAALHYQPRYAARSLRGRSHTIGLVLPGGGQALAEPLLAELLAGLTDMAARRGYTVLLASPTETQDELALYEELARSGRVDGLVLLDMRLVDERAQLLRRLKVAHACAAASDEPGGSPLVAVDGCTAAAMATRHLLGLGHRQIALIQLPSELAESEPRYLGYARTLEAAGVGQAPELVVEAGSAQSDGYEAMRELLALPEPPSAVLACSDALAFGAMHALRDAGLEVGREVSVVGFDDTPLAAHVYPPLTTLHLSRQELGAALARMVIDLIEQRPAQPMTTLQYRLVVRKSSGPYLHRT